MLLYACTVPSFVKLGSFFTMDLWLQREREVRERERERKREREVREREREEREREERQRDRVFALDKLDKERDREKERDLRFLEMIKALPEIDRVSALEKYIAIQEEGK